MRVVRDKLNKGFIIFFAKGYNQHQIHLIFLIQNLIIFKTLELLNGEEEVSSKANTS